MVNEKVNQPLELRGQVSMKIKCADRKEPFFSEIVIFYSEFLQFFSPLYMSPLFYYASGGLLV